MLDCFDDARCALGMLNPSTCPFFIVDSLNASVNVSPLVPNRREVSMKVYRPSLVRALVLPGLILSVLLFSLT